MHPAKSVIGFTTLSGLGYGLLILVIALSETGMIIVPPAWIRIFAGVGLVLVTIGLLFSLFHLGHPERAWRAYSQWRTSWLSREGVLASASYLPVVAWAYLRYTEGFPTTASNIAAVISVLICIATVYATSMIYRTLKPIPAWYNGYTSPVYMLFALVTGGVFLLALAGAGGIDTGIMPRIVAAGVFICIAVKGMYWMKMEKQPATATVEDATGLGHMGEVRQFEGAHTEENYLMKEMGFRIARKHAKRLKTIFNVTFLAGGLLAATGSPWLAMACVAIGTITERWLFFAEAKHAVQLYYGERSV